MDQIKKPIPENRLWWASFLFTKSTHPEMISNWRWNGFLANLGKQLEYRNRVTYYFAHRFQFYCNRSIVDHQRSSSWNYESTFDRRTPRGRRIKTGECFSLPVSNQWRGLWKRMRWGKNGSSEAIASTDLSPPEWAHIVTLFFLLQLFHPISLSTFCFERIKMRMGKI